MFLRFFQYWQKAKVPLGIVIGVFGLAAWFSLASGDSFKASVFHQTTGQTINSDTVFYIASSSASRGETGEIAIKVNKDITLQGFSFDLSYASDALTAHGYATENTALHGKNFLLQDNRSQAGTFKMAGAGSAPITLKGGDTFLLLSFSVANTISESTTKLPFALNNFAIIDANGNETNAKTQNGEMSLLSGKKFTIQNITPSAKGTINIEFSDILATNLILGCAQFSEQVLTSNSKLEQTANRLTFSGLALSAGKRYVVSFNTTVQSRQGIPLVPEQQTIEFVVPNDGTTPDINFDASLGITSAVAKDLTKIDVIFSSIPSGTNFLPSSIIIKNNTKTITVHSITQNSADKRVFHIETESMKPQTPYMLLLDTENWKTAANKKAGGTASYLFWTDAIISDASISNISPVRPVQGVKSTITISGSNFPSDAKIRVGGILLTDVVVSADKKTITATLPATLATGNYTLEIEYTKDGQIKNIKQENAILVSPKAEKEMEVISSKSYSSPLKVPNDGTTTTKLFVYVDDPRGLADLEKVTADLRVIHGNAAESLKPGPIENGQQVWFLENVKVPNTVQTKTEPYAIPVVAQNRAGITAEGTVLLWVSRDTTSSVPPRIVNFTVTPSTITAGDKDHSVLLSAEISDEDSGEEVTTVAVDLSQIGINTVFLTARNTGQVTGKTKFFENATPIVVPSEIQNGNYKIKLKVIDAQGDEATLEKQVTITRQSGLGPSMSSNDTYVTPSKSLIKDGKFSFAIHTKVTDPSGADNIASVSVNLSGLGLPPAIMTPGTKEGLSQWYSSSVLYIPDAVSVGKKKLHITATDKQGHSYEQELWVDVMYKQDSGRPPIVESTKNYITPAKAINDGKSSFAAYVFVKDADDDVSHVVLKMGNTALYNGLSLPKGTSSIDSSGEEVCVSTRTLLCMQPILKESGGQWYYLSDIIVPNTTASRDTPYALEVNAFDKTGKMAEGKLEIIVSSPENITINGQNEILYWQATQENTVQIVIKHPIDPKNFKKEWLSISSAENISDTLSIEGYTISPDGRLITLQTSKQLPSKAYALKIDAEKMGIKFTNLSSQVYPFSGFFKPEKTTSFRVTSMKAVSPTQFELTFSLPINARSMLTPNNIEIFIEGQKDKLEVRGLTMKNEKTLIVETAAQTAGQKYDTYYKGIESLYGEIMSKKQTIKTEAFKQSIGTTVGGLQATADFNSDGIVDFKDFTLFAAVYGKTYSQASSGDLNGDTTVDFKDFTLFSSLYGETLTPQASHTSPTTTHSNNGILPSSSASASASSSPSASPSPISSVFPSSFVVSPSSSALPMASGTPLPTFHYSAPSPNPMASQSATPTTTTTTTTTIPSDSSPIPSFPSSPPNQTSSPTPNPSTQALDPLVQLLSN